MMARNSGTGHAVLPGGENEPGNPEKPLSGAFLFAVPLRMCAHAGDCCGPSRYSVALSTGARGLRGVVLAAALWLGPAARGVAASASRTAVPVPAMLQPTEMNSLMSCSQVSPRVSHFRPARVSMPPPPPFPCPGLPACGIKGVGIVRRLARRRRGSGVSSKGEFACRCPEYLHTEPLLTHLSTLPTFHQYPSYVKVSLRMTGR